MPLATGGGVNVRVEREVVLGLLLCDSGCDTKGLGEAGVDPLLSPVPHAVLVGLGVNEGVAAVEKEESGEIEDLKDCVEPALSDPPAPLVVVAVPLRETILFVFDTAGVRESEGEGVILRDVAGVSEGMGELEDKEEVEGDWEVVIIADAVARVVKAGETVMVPVNVLTPVKEGSPRVAVGIRVYTPEGVPAPVPNAELEGESEAAGLRVDKGEARVPSAVYVLKGGVPVLLALVSGVIEELARVDAVLAEEGET